MLTTAGGVRRHGWITYKRPPQGKTILAELNDPDTKTAPMSDRYSLSKLIDLYIGRSIARLPAAQDVVVDVINPGLCISELRREMVGFVAWLLNKMAFTTEEGAKNVSRFLWRTWPCREQNTDACRLQTPDRVGLHFRHREWLVRLHHQGLPLEQVQPQ